MKSDADDERHVEEQIERDRGADHLGEVAGGDGDLADHPEEPDDGRRIVVAAGLREVAAGDDAELGGEPLQQHRHQVREEHDGEERVAEGRAAGEVGGPVAGVHVADGHEVAGPGEGEGLPPPRAVGDGDRPVGLGEARREPRPPPPGFGGRRGRVRAVRGWLP